MAFAYADYANYRQSVRSLCANCDDVEIPDSIVDAGNIHVDQLTARVNALKPDYDTLTAAEQLAVQIAAMKLLAARLCRTHCKGVYIKASDDQQSYDRQKIDWDALAGQLEGEALEILDAGTAPTPAMLVGGYADAATNRWDPIIKPVAGGGISLA